LGGCLYGDGGENDGGDGGDFTERNRHAKGIRASPCSFERRVVVDYEGSSYPVLRDPVVHGGQFLHLDIIVGGWWDRWVGGVGSCVRGRRGTEQSTVNKM